ncbi:MAG: 2-phosphoglycerate kinase [Actinobacteria bacterium]|nr:MAG: 2-phosphoglycerate kinase [Actinomycetota bacterium]
MSQPRRSDPLPLGGEHGLPFSKGMMARALMAVGVAPQRAYELARRVEDDLAAKGAETADRERLDELAIEILGEVEGTETVRQLRRYQDLRELDLPVIILVGGATGTGKSTVATEVAHRLGITRVTSTDFVRQTMRAFFSREFMPSIHYSSFEAGHGLPEEEQETGDPTLLGFLEQTRNVLVGVNASIERALEEGWSMVLEGIHLVPGMLPRIEGALVIECILHITDTENHRSHFLIRDIVSDERRAGSKYLDHLAEIRRIQTYIAERARKTGVAIVENADVERATGEVMELVVSAAERAREHVA